MRVCFIPTTKPTSERPLIGRRNPPNAPDQSMQAVYAMAFDKTGDFIASGALGGSLYVWSVKDGTIVRSFRKYCSLLMCLIRGLEFTTSIRASCRIGCLPPPI